MSINFVKLRLPNHYGSLTPESSYSLEFFYKLVRNLVVGSKEYSVFGSLDYRTFGINAVEEMALMNTESVSKVDQIILRLKNPVCPYP